MDDLQVPNSANQAKAKAVEAGWKMQASVMDAANKEGRDPPKYALLELIGRGSFGLVYKGQDVTTAEVVAVKIIDIDESDTGNPRYADSYSEFLKEVGTLKLMRESKARNINHVIDALSVGKTLWLITEYCGGGSVATLMKPIAPDGLQERWIIPILREAAEAVKWVHAAGIIHRDIKCANVLITELGDVKLCDFGVAGTLESKLEKRSTFIGTPHWMAPELFDTARSYGKEVDIWAFGAMIYEIATGFPPNVENGISYQNLGSHLKNNAPRLEGANFSVGLKNLAAYCLEVLPNYRPTIEQIQRHPYLYNSSSVYPTSSLSGLVTAYTLWERQGNGRESLVMASEILGPVEIVAPEEWIFTTTAAFDEATSLNGIKQSAQGASSSRVEDMSPSHTQSYSQESLAMSSKLELQRPEHGLPPFRCPLQKAFDPNTTSNYEDNSRLYYSPSSQFSGFEPTPSRNMSTSSQGSQFDFSDIDTADLAPHSSAGLGIIHGPEPRPTWQSEEDGYTSTAGLQKRPVRSESDSNAYRRTADWTFPSLEEQARLKAVPGPSEEKISFPSAESLFSGRPSLKHYPTDPTGTQWKSDDASFSPRQSLIDLDLAIPEISSPHSSTANTELDSTAPGSPFEFTSRDTPVGTTDREPSLYLDDSYFPSMSASTAGIANGPASLSDFKANASTTPLAVEKSSTQPPPQPKSLDTCPQGSLEAHHQVPVDPRSQVPFDARPQVPFDHHHHQVTIDHSLQIPLHAHHQLPHKVHPQGPLNSRPQVSVEAHPQAAVNPRPRVTFETRPQTPIDPRSRARREARPPPPLHARPHLLLEPRPRVQLPIDARPQASPIPRPQAPINARLRELSSFQFPDLPEPASAAALRGELSKDDMAKEMKRMLDGLADQMGAFGDVYDAAAVASRKNAGGRQDRSGKRRAD